MDLDASNQNTQPGAEGEVFYVPPTVSSADRRQATDPNYGDPERRQSDRRKPERRAQATEYELKSRAETIYPEAFIPVSKEFYEGLTKEQRDKLIRIQATAQEKVGFEKGAPKFFIQDFEPDGKSSRSSSAQTQTADPVSDAAPRLVIGGALMGAGLLATGLSLAHVLPGGMVLFGSIIGLCAGVVLAMNPRG